MVLSHTEFYVLNHAVPITLEVQMGFQRGRAQPGTLLVSVAAACALSWGGVSGE